MLNLFERKAEDGVNVSEPGEDRYLIGVDVDCVLIFRTTHLASIVVFVPILDLDCRLSRRWTCMCSWRRYCSSSNFCTVVPLPGVCSSLLRLLGSLNDGNASLKICNISSNLFCKVLKSRRVENLELRSISSLKREPSAVELVHFLYFLRILRTATIWAWAKRMRFWISSPTRRSLRSHLAARRWRRKTWDDECLAARFCIKRSAVRARASKI